MRDSLNQWIWETQRTYNIFKRMSVNDLKLLSKQAGLDLNHYKTKSMMAKGLVMTLTRGMIPVDFGSWK